MDGTVAYTFIHDSLYSLSLPISLDTLATEWNQNFTSKTPQIGLIEYGLALTEKRKLVLYGGITETFPMISHSSRLFQGFNDLWLLDFNDPSPTFTLVYWKNDGGGFLRLLAIGKEIICIINGKMKKKVLFLDIDEMQAFSLPLKIDESINRVGFGVSFYDNKIVVLGGFHQANGTVQPIETESILYEVSFSQFKPKQIPLNPADKLNETYIAIAISSVFCLGIIYIAYKKRKNIDFINTVRKIFVGDDLEKMYKSQMTGGPCEMQTKNMDMKLLYEKEMTHTNSHISNSGQDTKFSNKSNTSNGLDEITNGSNKEKEYEENMTFNQTLAPTVYDGLCVPLYRKCDFKKDIARESILAKGGFGKVYKGNIVNQNLAKEANMGELDCVIKMPFNVMDEKLFLQELSIHEVFKDNRYFARLIAYTDDPQSTILKFYPLGSLLEYVFQDNKKKSAVIEPYSIELVLSLSMKLALAVNFMHSKSYVHNDLKFGNILLDRDEYEALIPVLSDFGSVEILDQASVVKGFSLTTIKAGTLTYCAPEVLKSFKSKYKRVSTFKTDVYSFGILLLELFTRKQAWIDFQMEKVIGGAKPELSGGKILRVFKNLKSDTVLKMIRLISECYDFEPQKRPTMKKVLSSIAEIQSEFSSNP